MWDNSAYQMVFIVYCVVLEITIRRIKQNYLAEKYIINKTDQPGFELRLIDDTVGKMFHV